MVKFLSVLGVVLAAFLSVSFGFVQLWHLGVAAAVIALGVTVWVKTTESGAAFWDVYDTPVIIGSKALIFIALFTPFAWTVGSTLIMGQQLVFIKEVRSIGSGSNKEAEVIRPFGTSLGWKHSMEDLPENVLLISDTEVSVNGTRKPIAEVFPDMEVSRVLLTQNDFWWNYDRKVDSEELGTLQSKGQPTYIWTTHRNISLPGFVKKYICKDGGCEWAQLKLIEISDGGFFNHVTMVLAVYFGLIIAAYVLIRKGWTKLRDTFSKKTAVE